MRITQGIESAFPLSCRKLPNLRLSLCPSYPPMVRICASSSSLVERLPTVECDNKGRRGLHLVRSIVFGCDLLSFDQV